MADVYVNALTQITTEPTTTDSVVCVNRNTNEGKIIDYNKLADVILAKLASKQFSSLTTASKLLPGAINELDADTASMASSISQLNSRLNTVAIPSNSDLNNYLTPGIYGNPVGQSAATVANNPVRGAFLLEVLLLQPSTQGNWLGGIQRVTEYLGSKTYIRRINTNGSGTWEFGNWYLLTGTVQT